MRKNLVSNQDQLTFNWSFQPKAQEQEALLRQKVNELIDTLVQVIEYNYAAQIRVKIDLLTTTAWDTVPGQTNNYVYIHKILEFAVSLAGQVQEAFNNTIAQINHLRIYGSEDDMDETRAFLKKQLATFIRKIEELNTFMIYGRFIDINDLYCQPPSSSDWQLLRSITTEHDPGALEPVLLNYRAYGQKVFSIVASIAKRAELIPLTEHETSAYLDKEISHPHEQPISFSGKAGVKTEELDDFTLGLAADTLHYELNPHKSTIDGEFAVSVGDFRVIRALFQFQDEQQWLKGILKRIAYEAIETDLKHYIDISLFDQFMERTRPDMPKSLKRGVTKITLTRRHLLQDKLFDKDDSLVRVRLLHFDFLEKMCETYGLIGLEAKKSPPKGKVKAYIESPHHQDLRDLQFKKPPYNKGDQGDEQIFGVVSPILLTLNPSDITQREAPVKGQHSNYISSTHFREHKVEVENIKQKVILPPDVKFDTDFSQKSLGSFFDSNEAKTFERVIVHIHGGGFVAQTSSSHKVYLNTWANKYQIPIFSIDYHLAPHAKVPQQMDEVVGAYLWLLNHLEFVLGVRPKQIIGMGDSAGGNLIIGLTIWCIENGVRPPDSVVACYPAMNLTESTFTPSMLMSINDILLNYAALRMCTAYYLDKDQDASTNHYISPLFVSDEVLAKFPPVHLYICDRDALRDDGMRFALKAKKAGAPVNVHFWKHLNHAALGAASSMPEAKAFMDKVMEEVLNLKKVPLETTSWFGFF